MLHFLTWNNATFHMPLSSGGLVTSKHEYRADEVLLWFKYYSRATLFHPSSVFFLQPFLFVHYSLFASSILSPNTEQPDKVTRFGYLLHLSVTQSSFLDVITCKCFYRPTRSVGEWSLKQRITSTANIYGRAFYLRALQLRGTFSAARPKVVQHKNSTSTKQTLYSSTATPPAVINWLLWQWRWDSIAVVRGKVSVRRMCCDLRLKLGRNKRRFSLEYGRWQLLKNNVWTLEARAHVNKQG